MAEDHDVRGTAGDSILELAGHNFSYPRALFAIKHSVVGEYNPSLGNVSKRSGSGPVIYSSYQLVYVCVQTIVKPPRKSSHLVLDQLAQVASRRT